MKYLKIKNYYPHLIILISSILYMLIAYKGVTGGSFIFSGDQYFPLSENDLNKTFAKILNPKNFGMTDGFGTILNVWDTLYYKLFYIFSDKFVIANKINIAIYNYIALTLAYMGFKRWQKLLFDNTSYLSLLIAYFYVFSPYTLELAHGGVFNITNAITYSLAPLSMYLLHKILTEKIINRNQYFLFAIVIFFQAFQFWLFFTFLIILFIYASIIIITSDFSEKIVLIKRCSLLTLICIISCLPIIIILLYQITFNVNVLNSTFNPVFGNMQGGLWFQMKMLHSWGIYNVWEPRAMYSFGNYFFSDRYNFIIVLLYTTLTFGIVKILFNLDSKIIFNNKYFNITLNNPYYSINRVPLNKIVLIFIFILIFALFFSKGAQKPFGEIFLWLYNNVYFFQIFRTPDIRFGFIIILIISILLLVITSKVANQYLSILIILFLLIASWPHFNGLALRGENIPGRYFDRVVSLSEDYVTAANYINIINPEYVYISPSIDYGKYPLGSDFYVGQDLFEKLINAPVYSGQVDTSIKKNTFEAFNEIRNNINFLIHFPISHVVLRNDIKDDNQILKESDLAKISTLIFKNNTFKIYRIANSNSILNIDFTKVSNYFYIINQSESYPSKLNLLLSYDKGWVLMKKTSSNCISRINYICDIYHKLSTLKYIIINHSTLEIPSLYKNYAMQWNINNNESYYLVYYPQLIFDLLIFLYLFFLILCILALISFLIINKSIRFSSST
jgi:hypothetical protein